MSRLTSRRTIPKDVDWQSLMRLDGDELEIHYGNKRHWLSEERACSGSEGAEEERNDQ